MPTFENEFDNDNKVVVITAGLNDARIYIPWRKWRLANFDTIFKNTNNKPEKLCHSVQRHTRTKVKKF